MISNSVSIVNGTKAGMISAGANWIDINLHWIAETSMSLPSRWTPSTIVPIAFDAVKDLRQILVIVWKRSLLSILIDHRAISFDDP